MKNKKKKEKKHFIQKKENLNNLLKDDFKKNEGKKFF